MKATGLPQIDIRSAGSRSAHEYYLRAVLDNAEVSPDSVYDAFDALYAFVAEAGAAIAHERVFMPPAHAPTVARAWRTVSRGRHDGVHPCFLTADPQQSELIIQLHAIAGVDAPTILALDGRPVARIFRHAGARWCIGSGIRPETRTQRPAQADSVFRRTRALLQQAGMTLHDVARTWIFMRDILDWYGEFNGARNRLFIEDGLLVPGAAGSVPASTGIGVAPADPFACTLDFFAVSGRPDCVRRFEAAGRQRSACEYGSAFARASRVLSPAGATGFVSGTAAIDTEGRTCFADDAEGQIRMTMQNVVAVLGDIDCTPRDTVAAIAYCKTPAIEAVFREQFMQQFDWPWAVVVGDVCRDDLLFEIELTAVPGTRTLATR